MLLKSLNVVRQLKLSFLGAKLRVETLNQLALNGLEFKTKTFFIESENMAASDVISHTDCRTCPQIKIRR